jgi:hypothetical protein
VRSAGTRYFFLSIVAMSDFSTFSQMTWEYAIRLAELTIDEWEASCATHRNAVGVFLADALCFCLALLEGVLVLELGSHDDGRYRKGIWSSRGSL